MEHCDSLFTWATRQGADFMAARKERVYIYVVARDFGFAPNPFHGYCTLGCCISPLRATAEVGDWVFGVGGSRLKATGRCIFGMRISETLSFDEYWKEDRFFSKRPVRNGSRVMMVGDNIYHRTDGGAWVQEHSHHSNPDGSQDFVNTQNDTKINKVLISERFLYFGAKAPVVPNFAFESLGYQNVRSPRHFPTEQASDLLAWFKEIEAISASRLLGDPFEFRDSAAYYSGEKGRVIRESAQTLAVQ